MEMETRFPDQAQTGMTNSDSHSNVHLSLTKLIHPLGRRLGRKAQRQLDHVTVGADDEVLRLHEHGVQQRAGLRPRHLPGEKERGNLVTRSS